MSTEEDLLNALRSSDEEEETTAEERPSQPAAEGEATAPPEPEVASVEPEDSAQGEAAAALDATPEAPASPESQATTEAPQTAADEEVREVADAGEAPEASVEEADGEAEDDEEEEDTTSFLFPIGDWFVVHTYAGYENKVKANLASRIQSMNMEDKIYEVVVPTEEVMELKSGKMTAVSKKVFPGYILVRMNLDDDSWYVVRNTPGVTGFVGPTGARPMPLAPEEVESILAPKAEDRPRPQLEYEEGEVVSVIGGAFNGYSGPVSAIDVDKQRVTVLLDLFGRETPVEVTFDQVTKL